MLLLLFQPLSRVRLFCNPMDCSLPSSSVHRISQARILERVAISFSNMLQFFKKVNTQAHTPSSSHFDRRESEHIFPFVRAKKSLFFFPPAELMPAQNYMAWTRGVFLSAVPSSAAPGAAGEGHSAVLCLVLLSSGEGLRLRQKIHSNLSQEKRGPRL